MATSTHAAAKQQAAREKFRVAGSSLLAATLLVVLKLVVGLLTGSLGILAEAAHSGLDLLAAGITLWAVRMSARPADRQQTYGYGKFENLSAVFEMLLLLATCVWIVYEAAGRLLFRRQIEINLSLWAFLVVLLSIAVDYWRSRALWRVSQKYHSRALEADALHFSTDIWSSAVVLLGLLGVAAAQHWSLFWLLQADTLAALGVAAIVVWVSLKLGKKSVDDLLDRIPDDLRDRVIQAAGRVPGVERVTQVRLRRAGSEVFADVTLAVGRAVSFEQAHEIADRAAEAVRSVVAEADVVVHPEPAAEDALDLTTKVRVLAARHGLGAHAIRFYEEHAQRWLELHLEVQESLSLEEAHRHATAFEQDVRTELPGLTQVVSHLEPAGDATALVQAEPADESQVRSALEEFFRAHRVSTESLHNVKVQRAGGTLSVSFHCRLEADTAIADAHEFTVRAEEFLRRRIPGLGRVVIHVEPQR
ncbi:MAG: cation diffusion facilitator family transporter [Thermoguttaceae bacterium]|jgi:cation diffusion facilitator family transporter